MTHGSLFSGIGGFDLAAKWMGWENIFHCEWNPFGQKVLKHHFPNSISYNDITKTDFTIHRGNIDILTGGFPCQPYSVAGLRKGKADERHLFPEMLRAIKEIQPRYIVGENVRGLVSWGGGLVFNEVCADLESEGYAVQPFIIPAASVNAPHRRDRIWFVAFKDTNKNGWGSIKREKKSNKWEQWNISTGDNESIQTNHEKIGIVAYANDKRGSSGFTEISKKDGEISEWNKDSKSSNADNFSAWKDFPTVSPVCNGDDGLSDRLDNITFSKWRKESIKAGGNAIVPQVAYEIFKTIKKMELNESRS
jgi:DNA (cytosine-5)-methyltransferase 1